MAGTVPTPLLILGAAVVIAFLISHLRREYDPADPHDRAAMREDAWYGSAFVRHRTQSLPIRQRRMKGTS